MLTLKSPAKVNLFLKLLRKRKDGFHEIATLMQAVSLFDTIQIEKSKKDHFLVEGSESLPEDARNLVIQARELFRKKTGLLNPVSIILKKKIPLQSGLGGGSSNAATTLYGLKKLFNCSVSDKKLLTWSSAIGSDVPFFFSEGLALCEGRGERVKELSIRSKLFVTIIKPSFGLNTKEVYSHVKLMKNLKHFDTIQLTNDLEIPAFKISPELQKLKEELTVFDAPVLLSGSGSALILFKQMPISDRNYFFAESVFRTKNSWYEET